MKFHKPDSIFFWSTECAVSQMCSVYVTNELYGIKKEKSQWSLLMWICHRYNMSTFWESVCSSTLEITRLPLDVDLVGSLEGLTSPSGFLHVVSSCEECGLLGLSSSSEVRLWSLMLSVISFNFCLRCCSSRSTSSHWGREKLLIGDAWLVGRSKVGIKCLRQMPLGMISTSNL